MEFKAFSNALQSTSIVVGMCQRRIDHICNAITLINHVFGIISSISRAALFVYVFGRHLFLLAITKEERQQQLSLTIHTLRNAIDKV